MQPADDLLAGLVEALPVGVFAAAADGRILLWNAAAERLTGCPRDRVLGRLPTDLPVDRATVARILDEVRAGRASAGRLPATVPSGVTVSYRAARGTAAAVVGVLQDADDIMAADTADGDESFALLDALWENAPVGLAYFDTELRFRRVNGAVLDIDGGTLDERLGQTVEAVHGATGAAIAANLRAVLADGRARLDVPVTGRLFHGRRQLQEWRMDHYPVRSPAGSIVGVGLVLTDVTAAERGRRELAEVAAQREHALNRYQSLVAATSAAVWIRAADGRAEQDAPALRAITGQSAAELAGWGFLDAVHPAHRDELGAAWRAAVAAEPAEVFTHVQRLRTADGGHRWFRTRAVPVRAGGRVVEWVGTETDVDDAMRARERLDVLATATFAMNAALDPEGELTALAEAVVPQFADVCRAYLLDDGPGRRPAARSPNHMAPYGMQPDGLAGSAPGGAVGRRSVTRYGPGIAPSPSGDERFAFGPDHPISRSARTGEPVLVQSPAVPTPLWRTTDEQARWGLEIGVSSMLVAPVLSAGRTVAALLFVACGDRPRYTSDDLALVRELATRASTAVENAVTYQQTREVAVALQAAMLTEPPQHPGVEVVARYLPAAAGLTVGGDWYDAFPLPGGDLAVGVGDVAGHDLPAAAEMGQLRSMLRGLAHDSEAAPSVVLGRLDRVVSRLGVTRFTTLIYGRLSVAGGGAILRWSSAGHPAPVLVEPGCAPRLLTGETDVVLGVDPGGERHDNEVRLVAGSTLLLYTDGLVERRSDPDDRATTELLAMVAAGAGLPLADFCDHLVRRTAADTGDDIALLALRLPP